MNPSISTYLSLQVYPVLDELVLALIRARPADPVSFMMEFLEQKRPTARVNDSKAEIFDIHSEHGEVEEVNNLVEPSLEVNDPVEPSLQVDASLKVNELETASLGVDPNIAEPTELNEPSLVEQNFDSLDPFGAGAMPDVYLSDPFTVEIQVHDEAQLDAEEPEFREIVVPAIDAQPENTSIPEEASPASLQETTQMEEVLLEEPIDPAADMITQEMEQIIQPEEPEPEGPPPVVSAWSDFDLDDLLANQPATVQPVESEPVVPVQQLFDQVHAPVVQTNDLGSPLGSVGLMSPSHSPRNVASYLSKGKRTSVPGESDRCAIPHEEKSDEERKRILDTFGMSAMFSSVGQSVNEQRLLVDALSREEYPEDGTVVDMSDSYILVDAGHVQAGGSMFAHGNILGSPGAGMFHIPIAESDSVTTVGESVRVYRILRNVYDQIVRQASVARREKIINYLGQIPHFASTADIARLSDAVREEEFPAYSEVVVEGDTGTKMYIVNDDHCLVGINDVDVFQYVPGDFFGSEAFAQNQPQPYTVTVTTSSDTILFTIDRHDYERMFGAIESSSL
jgi:hypothetical protein